MVEIHFIYLCRDVICSYCKNTVKIYTVKIILHFKPDPNLHLLHCTQPGAPTPNPRPQVNGHAPGAAEYLGVVA